MTTSSDRVPSWQMRRLLAWCVLSTGLLLLLLPVLTVAESYGYDSASTCDPTRASRRGRSQLLKTIPCDLSVQAYCNLPGSAYPWHAVRRFVHENQGLMRRMYGDVRHISVLKEEFENNEIDIDDIDRAAERYARPPAVSAPLGRDGKRMKYLRPSPSHYEVGSSHYAREKSNEIPLNEPHFRPAQLKSTTTTTTTTTTTPSTTTSTSSTGVPTVPTEDGSNLPTTKTSSTTASTTVESPPPKTSQLSTEQAVSSTTEMAPNIQESSPSPDRHPTTTSSAVEDDSRSGPGKFSETGPLAVGRDAMQSADAEAIDMDALSSLAKLGTGEALKSTPSTREPDQEKISSTLKLASSNAAPVGDADRKEVPVTEGVSTAEDVESTISTYPNDRQDTGAVDGTEEEDPEKANVGKTVAEPLVQHDAAPVASTIQQQKIRFESIKPHPGVGGVAVPLGSSTTPTKKITGGESQLFQDTAQKDPPVVNGRGVNACPVKEEVVAPFWANNTRGEVLALLNLYPFEQYVHWEKCTHELKQMYCREGCRCEQQYRLHRLLAYDPHNECRGIFSDWFRFPSCCICKCYDMPFDFRVTSRSPRSLTKESIELVEDELQNAIYEHATDEWYRPKEYDVD